MLVKVIVVLAAREKIVVVEIYPDISSGAQSTIGSGFETGQSYLSRCKFLYRRTGSTGGLGNNRIGSRNDRRLNLMVESNAADSLRILCFPRAGSSARRFLPASMEASGECIALGLGLVK